ncbi:unnamed protein product [Natator depressus]
MSRLCPSLDTKDYRLRAALFGRSNVVFSHSYDAAPLSAYPAFSPHLPGRLLLFLLLLPGLLRFGCLCFTLACLSQESLICTLLRKSSDGTLATFFFCWCWKRRVVMWDGVFGVFFWKGGDVNPK